MRSVALSLLLAGCTTSFDPALLDGGACEGCVRRCDEVADGTPCRGGTCRAGACCRGCWNGTACVEGNVDTGCGTGGAACRGCLPPTDRCEEGLCISTRPVLAVATQESHTCLIESGGFLHCFGANGHGALGNPTVDFETRVPTLVAGDDWAKVSVGGGYNQATCGIRDDGTLHCWGSNVVGQLGTGDGEGHPVPAPVAGGGTWLASANGEAAACAVRPEGTLWCWGYNPEDGRAGGTARGTTDVPEQVGTRADFRDVVMGRTHGCALTTTDVLFCWGSDVAGERGHDDPTMPGIVQPGIAWRTVAAGRVHTCAIRTDGTLWCWGSNATGQLGAPPDPDRHAPLPIGADTDWTAVTAGDGFTCGLRGDGRATCFGENADGQLGDGTLTARHEPAPVVTELRFTTIDAGNAHVCAAATDGVLYCWGDGSNSANGSAREDLTSPTAVPLP